MTALTDQEIAAKRGLQTLVDGVIAAVIVGVLLPMIGAVQSSESWMAWASDWQMWTWTAFQSAFVGVGTAAISWVRRRFVQPAGSDAPTVEQA
jgi:hypothetical protein